MSEPVVGQKRLFFNGRNQFSIFESSNDEEHSTTHTKARAVEGEVTTQVAEKREIDSKEQIGLAESPQGVGRS
jgi:hypothetical protein